MLILSRRVGEEIVIQGNVRLTIVAVKGDRVRLGILAPPSVTVDRKEIHDRRAELAIDALPALARRSERTVRH
jgi:carbon storage regulator